MEYTRKYEDILRELCNLYKKMLPLIGQLENCDRALKAVTSVDMPDVRKIRSITTHKEKLVKSLDHISIGISKLHVKLAAVSELYPELDDSRLYRYMQKLHTEAYSGICRINANEDTDNPFIIKRLNKFKKLFESEA